MGGHLLLLLVSLRLPSQLEGPRNSTLTVQLLEGLANDPRLAVA